MLFNYFTVTLRNLARYKVFSIINVAGMSISLASCLLIILFVYDELQYDKHHPDGERTFRVYNVRETDGVKNYLPIVPYPFATFMQKDFPEIESTVRLMDTYEKKTFEFNGDKILEADGVYAEPAVFDMLSLRVISGESASALTEPYSVALSESLAIKYFGDRNAVGESIRINFEEWKVTAVYADPPQHFHLKLNYVLSFATMSHATQNENNWQFQQFFTYLKLKPGSDAKALEAKLKPFVEKYAYPYIQTKGFTYVPYLQNIADIHLNSSQFEWEIAQRGNGQTVYILAGTAILILVIACLNFVNLSTARAIKRMKEVGVRKVVGANRKQLITQFLAESVLFSLTGFILALVIAELSLPSLNLIMEKQLALPYSPLYLSGQVVFCTVLGLVAGLYPAWYLSRFSPVSVLSRKYEKSGRGTSFRESLVVVQFMLSFFLISASWIVLSQNEFVKTKNLGFDKEHIVVIPLTRDQLKNQEVTKRKYSDHPNVISATMGFGLPGDIIAGDDITDPVTGRILPVNLFCVDFDYIGTLGLNVIAGRNFSEDIPADSSEAFILNETAVSTLGFGTPEEAIGKRIDWNRWHDDNIKKGYVIGVVRDFNFNSLREKITPTVLHIYPQTAWKMALRIKPNNIDETIAHFSKTYQSLESRWMFTYSFLDENFDAMYKSEEKLGTLFTIFTYLAIAVACMGLFGLVEYSVNQRTKEIGIRKVLGAPLASLVVLLTKRYFLLLLVACVLIVPVTYYLAGEWLNNFEYRIEVSMVMFMQAAAVILLITGFTVSFKSIQGALTNPAEVLKNE